jgi:hypothetical protein
MAPVPLMRILKVRLSPHVTASDVLWMISPLLAVVLTTSIFSSAALTLTETENARMKASVNASLLFSHFIFGTPFFLEKARLPTVCRGCVFLEAKAQNKRKFLAFCRQVACLGLCPMRETAFKAVAKKAKSFMLAVLGGQYIRFKLATQAFLPARPSRRTLLPQPQQ